MNTVALGSWSKPPLAYVVAELIISPYYSMSDAIPALQDSLRAAYPRTIDGQELVIEGGKPLPQPIWQLMSADQKYGVQFRTRSISFHATSYLHSGDFLGRWEEVLNAVEAAQLGAFVERAGIRYIDLIVPSDDNTPAAYLNERLQGIAPAGAVPTGTMWVAAFRFSSSTVNLRAAAPAPQGLLLPPDFNALPLHKPQVMIEAELRIQEGSAIGFIDTDCMENTQQVFNASVLLATYGGMQKLVSRTFKAALSPLATKEWM